MDYTWNPPSEDYVKINVHCVSQTDPLPNGNRNGVGVIARDFRGRMLWSACGPMNEMSTMAAILWGIHAGAMFCLEKGIQKTHIETDNWGVYNFLNFEEENHIAEEFAEVLSMLNTIHANNFKEGETDRIVYIIPFRKNSTAQYLAQYGMEHFNNFGILDGAVGDVQDFLNRDMGIGFPMNINIHLGHGEVHDEPQLVPQEPAEDGNENEPVE